MNFKKLTFQMLATGIAISALSLSSSAAIKNGNGSQFGDSDSKYIFDVVADAGDKAFDVTGITIKLTVEGPEDGFGGGLACQSGADFPGFIEWGNADAGKPLISDGTTLTYTSETPIFTANDEGTAKVLIEAWWGGDMEILGIEYTYGSTDDNASDTAAEDVPSDDTVSEAAADDDAADDAADDEVATDEAADDEVANEDTTDEDTLTDDTDVVVDNASDNGSSSTTTESDDIKGSADTGIQDMAVVGGIAILTTGVIIISRKRRV